MAEGESTVESVGIGNLPHQWIPNNSDPGPDHQNPEPNHPRPETPLAGS